MTDFKNTPELSESTEPAISYRTIPEGTKLMSIL